MNRSYPHVTKRASQCTKLPLCTGYKKGTNHKDLLYIFLPCIFARGYFQLEHMTSQSHGSNFTCYTNAPLPTTFNTQLQKVCSCLKPKPKPTLRIEPFAIVLSNEVGHFTAVFSIEQVVYLILIGKYKFKRTKLADFVVFKTRKNLFYFYIGKYITSTGNGL